MAEAVRPRAVLKRDGILPSLHVHFSKFRLNTCSTRLTARFREACSSPFVALRSSFYWTLEVQTPYRIPPSFPPVGDDLASESTLFRFKTGRQNPVSEETASMLKEETSDTACVFCFDASFSSVSQTVTIGCVLQLETQLVVQSREAPLREIMARPWRPSGSRLFVNVMRPIRTVSKARTGFESITMRRATLRSSRGREHR